MYHGADWIFPSCQTFLEPGYQHERGRSKRGRGPVYIPANRGSAAVSLDEVEVLLPQDDALPPLPGSGSLTSFFLELARRSQAELISADRDMERAFGAMMVGRHRPKR